MAVVAAVGLYAWIMMRLSGIAIMTISLFEHDLQANFVFVPKKTGFRFSGSWDYAF
jgi:succinate dehydrogenase/fumarate reductase cytochrome b subunit